MATPDALPPPPMFMTPTEWARRMAVSTAGGLFMGATGGFGTFVATPLPERMLAWLVMFWSGGIIYSLALGPIITWGRRLGAPLWSSVSAALVLATAPMTAATFLATTYIMHTGQRQPWLERYWQVLIVVFPVIGGYIAIHELLKRQAAGPGPASESVAEPAPAAPRLAPFLARLPPRLGRDLLCLEMEDHYVRAHTALGSDLILMRMRDAVAELEGLEGLQTHRSWWVARSAVEGSQRDNGALRLRLRNGLTVPVARATAPEVKAAGWLG